MFKRALFGIWGLTIVLGGSGLASAASFSIVRNSTDYTGETGLNNDVSTETKYLYINENGTVTTSDPSGASDVYVYALRTRDKNLSPNDLREQVTVQGGDSGFNTTSRTIGANISAAWSYGGGNLLYRKGSTPGDTYSSFTNEYFAFRIYISPGQYQYGWARMSGFIKTENAIYDKNQASVTLTDLAIADTPNIQLAIGQTSFDVIDTVRTMADWTYAGGQSYDFVVNNSSGSAGTNWNLFEVNDLLNITATSGDAFTVNIASLTAGNVAGNADGFNGGVGTTYQFLMADAVSSISNFASNDFVLDTTGFSNDVELDWNIVLGSDASITGGDDTQIYLTATVVPEPATMGLLTVGGLAMLRRRRK